MAALVLMMGLPLAPGFAPTVPHFGRPVVGQSQPGLHCARRSPTTRHRTLARAANGSQAAGERSTTELAGQLLRLAVPTLAVVLVEPTLTLIDTWFVGGLATAALAALSANCSLFNLISCCMSFLTMSATSLVASAGAAPKDAGNGVKQGVAVACIAGSLLAG